MLFGNSIVPTLKYVSGLVRFFELCSSSTGRISFIDAQDFLRFILVQNCLLDEATRSLNCFSGADRPMKGGVAISLKLKTCLVLHYFSSLFTTNQINLLYIHCFSGTTMTVHAAGFTVVPCIDGELRCIVSQWNHYSVNSKLYCSDSRAEYLLQASVEEIMKNVVLDCTSSRSCYHISQSIQMLGQQHHGCWPQSIAEGSGNH